MVKEDSKTLFINVKTPVSFRNGGIELTLVHQFTLYIDKKDNYSVDIELVDFEDIYFMGKRLKDTSYQGFKKFKENLSELGIDLDDMVREKSEDLFSPIEIEFLKLKYKDIFS